MNPNEFRQAGHRVVDRLADYLESVENKRLFPEITPNALEALFDEPLPDDETPLDAILAELDEKLFPYCCEVNHPGYMGLITPSPSPAGILGDFIASALNQNVGAYTIGPSAVAMERRTVRWLTDLAGYGPGAGGNLTSGGMMANFLGLKLARDHVSGDRAQHEGVTRRWAAYTSEERHISVDKSCDAVGIGRDGLRVLPTNAQFQLDLEALDAAIAADRKNGVTPMCVIAMGGSTNNGAVDDLAALRKLCDREKMWLHVDAAYGGGMFLSRRRPGVLAGIERADSITIDPHKWFFAPLDAGAILVRDETQLTRSFGQKPAYLTDEMDAGGERYQYYVHGFEQSRRFRSLKVWMAFKRYGSRRIGGWIDANLEQADRLYDLASAHPDFEVAVKPVMSAICIRSLADGGNEAASARRHAAVVRRIEEAGRFWFSTTQLKGKTWFRINPVNFRTRLEHMDELFATLVAECARQDFQS